MEAIMLLSGGLDSRLAMRLLLDQGVRLHALNHVSVFCTCTERSRCRHRAWEAAEETGVSLTVRNVTEDLLRIVERPEHGYGSGLNPCIDCRILLFRGASSLMRRRGARFVVTGEVLGERPMSQRLEAMRHIERESGLAGLVVRPLSALALEPSIPERLGWVDRSRFLGITGRRRTPQMELAESYGLGDYPCPAGGCRLTDPGFARRMRDLMAHGCLKADDVALLRVGRHFRLSPAAKLVVGRDESENATIRLSVRPGDWLVEAEECTGALSLARGELDDDLLRLAGAVTARYGKQKDRGLVRVSVRGAREDSFEVPPTQNRDLAELRV